MINMSSITWLLTREECETDAKGVIVSCEENTPEEIELLDCLTSMYNEV